MHDLLNKSRQEWPQKSHKQKKHLQINQSIFASYGTHTTNYFVCGDFYMSGMHDTEVTKSLL